jgi:broad specificity phosphatase PhoE
MSTLVLVRHGQAAPFDSAFVGLTPTGDEQARRLGAFWARRGERFDTVFAGTLGRQIRTAELARGSMRAAGLPCPDVQVLEELDEYDAGAILELLVPLLAARDADFQKLVEACRLGAAGTERSRHFQRMFERVMAAWLDGKLEADGVETWPAFRVRVERAVARVTAGDGRGRRIAVFTSGGPIGLTVQRILAAPERAALELNWRIRNASLTEITFSGGRFSLDTFNTVPHLDDPSLWTYR